MLNVRQNTNRKLRDLAMKSNGLLLCSEVEQALENIIEQVDTFEDVDSKEVDTLFNVYLPGFSRLGTNYICVNCLQHGVETGKMIQLDGIKPLQPECEEVDIPEELNLLPIDQVQHQFHKTLSTVENNGMLDIDPDNLFQHIPGYVCTWKWSIEFRAWDVVNEQPTSFLILNDIGYRCNVQRERRIQKYE